MWPFHEAYLVVVCRLWKKRKTKFFKNTYPFSWKIEKLVLKYTTKSEEFFWISYYLWNLMYLVLINNNKNKIIHKRQLIYIKLKKYIVYILWLYTNCFLKLVDNEYRDYDSKQKAIKIWVKPKSKYRTKSNQCNHHLVTGVLPSCYRQFYNSLFTAPVLMKNMQDFDLACRYRLKSVDTVNLRTGDNM